MDWLSQASAKKTRYAEPNIGPDLVPCITVHNYQLESLHCDSRSALLKHIFRF